MKPPRSQSQSLLLLLSIASFLAATSAATCHADDQQGLVGFKSGITHDPTGLLSSWKAGTDCCSWHGVSCDADHRVTTITLYGNPQTGTPLNGTISPYIYKLRFLTGIYLDRLGISGSFPGAFFRMPKLQYIYIENNRLTGRLPRDIGNMTQLIALSFAGNRFIGPIPSSISNLKNLVQLKLGGNFLTGPVPVGIGKLVNVTYLSLAGNRLSGKIPDVFRTLTELRALDLSDNRLSSTIPASISALAPNLIDLLLGNNALTGQIPSFLGNFRTLDTLNLSRNGFSGTVPKSFGNLTKIFNLDLGHNNLVDPFPAMSVKGIESLDLSHNKFNLGTIPKWVASSPIIYSLKLAKCGIKMSLDSWKPVETYFYDYIDLSENEISGSPVNLLNRTDYLVGFWASGNKLKFDLGKLRIVKTMKDLDVSRNLVFGKVPAAVAGLGKLNVSHNHLCGKLPATKFPASAFVGNDCLCGSPLAACK